MMRLSTWILQETLTEGKGGRKEKATIQQNSKCAHSRKLAQIITQVPWGKETPDPQEPTEEGEYDEVPEIVCGKKRDSDMGKKTLVLDLDETLVHSSFNEVEECDLVLPVEIDGSTCEVFVLKRPGVDKFLTDLAKDYELMIYTASLQKYADPLLDWLDPQNLIAYRLFWEQCTFYNGIFVKDLSRIDRDLKDCIIIDNSPTSYLFHPENALPTESWYDDMSCTELYQFIPILQALAKVDDVTQHLSVFIEENVVNFKKAQRHFELDKPVKRVKIN